MFRTHFVILSSIILTVAFSACDLINPAEPIPCYLQIDSFVLANNPRVDEGSLSHNILDAWVFVDGEMIGVFELPAKIPILEAGAHKLTIGPGILNSTISSFRENYPFYTAYIDESFDFIAGETIPLTPVCTYRDDDPNYTYVVVEDFETSIVTIDSFAESEVPIDKTTDPALVFEGEGSGEMKLTANTSKARFRTPSYAFPSGGKPAFVEINYYSDFSFIIGVLVNNDRLQNEPIDYLTLKPTTDDVGEKRWKKAYIDISTITNDSPNAIDYYIYFDATLFDASDRKEGRIMVDNIKFIHQR